MVTFQFDWPFAWEVFFVCLKRVPVCFLAATAAMFAGLVLGIPLAAARQGGRTRRGNSRSRRGKKLAALLANAWVHLIRGVPTILLLLILYLSIRNGFNALAARFHWTVKATVIPAFWIAVIALGLSAGALLQEASGKTDHKNRIKITKTPERRIAPDYRSRVFLAFL